jgi:lycopene cyclase-like protein
MESRYAYLVLSSALFGAWLVLAAVRSDIRREMVRVSVGTMFLGLTEPLFVPEYWNPPTLGDLARRTGFDLESLLFSFAIGGIVFSAYHVLFGGAPSERMAHERGHPRHRYHALAILCAPVGFVVLWALTTLNPIYAAAIALVGGFLVTLYCRPDLWHKMLVSGVLFFLLYFVVFAVFNLAFPGYVAAVWNLNAVSGLLLWGVPFEELLFAFTFGLYWSSLYEHLAWRRTHWPSGIAHGRGEVWPATGGERIP